MRAKTKAGDRLKRLAARFARAHHDSVEGFPKEIHAEMMIHLAKAKKALWDAIDEATSIDLAPRDMGNYP